MGPSASRPHTDTPGSLVHVPAALTAPPYSLPRRCALLPSQRSLPAGATCVRCASPPVRLHPGVAYLHPSVRRTFAHWCLMRSAPHPAPPPQAAPPAALPVCTSPLLLPLAVLAVPRAPSRDCSSASPLCSGHHTLAAPHRHHTRHDCSRLPLRPTLSAVCSSLPAAIATRARCPGSRHLLAAGHCLRIRTRVHSPASLLCSVRRTLAHRGLGRRIMPAGQLATSVAMPAACLHRKGLLTIATACT
ncbi:hypothetical protein B0H14DRAFT_2796791 [Mycena olivaceomarginata]|nr:hypothetical protein B0H14DRAFT_2796791 [Mycena olivaceomarginata]